MKKFVTIVALVFLSLFSMRAEGYAPTSTWPYVYEDFVGGVLEFRDGQTKTGSFNIVLTDSKLHFLDGDIVNEARMFDIVQVSIGDDVYVNLGGKLFKLLSRSDNSLVVEGTEIDYAKLNSSEGAYGSSTASVSTQSLSSLEGIGGSHTNMSHMVLKNSKEEGTSLSLIVKKYVVVDGLPVFASKRDVLAFAERKGHKSEVSSFIKNDKTKWKSTASLQQLADYLASI